MSYPMGMDAAGRVLSVWHRMGERTCVRLHTGAIGYVPHAAAFVGNDVVILDAQRIG